MKKKLLQVWDFIRKFKYFTILANAIKEVPFLKYTLGVVGVFAALAIIAMFKLDSYKLNVIGFLSIIGATLLLFILSTFVNSKNTAVKRTGEFFIYFLGFVVGISVFFLITSVFFDFPKPICAYTNDCNPMRDKNNLSEATPFFEPDTCKILIGVANFLDENYSEDSVGMKLAGNIEDALEIIINSTDDYSRMINPVLRLRESVTKLNYREIQKKYHLDVLVFGKSCMGQNDTLKYCPIAYTNSEKLEYGNPKVTSLNSILTNNIDFLVPQQARKLIDYMIGSYYLGETKCALNWSAFFGPDRGYEVLKNSFDGTVHSELDIEIALVLIEACFSQSKYDEAFEISNQLLEQSNFDLSNVQRLELFIDIGEYYYNQKDSAALVKGIDLLKQNENLCNLTDDFELILDFYNELGILQLDFGYYVGDFSKASITFDNGIAYGYKVQSKMDRILWLNQMGKLLSNLGRVLLAKKEFDEAMLKFKMGLNFRIQGLNKLEIAICYANIGDVFIYSDHPDSDTAIYYYKKALETTEQNGAVDPQLLNVLGHLLYRQKKYEESNIYFLRCLDICKKEKWDKRSIVCYKRIVVNFENLGRKDSVEYYSKGGLELSKEMKIDSLISFFKARL